MKTNANVGDRYRRTRLNDVGLGVWIENKQTLEGLLNNRPEVSKKAARLASQNKLFAGRELLVECQDDLKAYVAVYDALSIYDSTPLGMIKDKTATLKSFIDSTVDIIAHHIRLQYGDANETIATSLGKLFSTSDNAEKYNQVTSINSLAKNYFLFDDAIILGGIDLALSNSAETHKANQFIITYGRAVHELETFSVQLIEREYSRAVSAIDVRDLAEGLELELKSMIEVQKTNLENYLSFFPVQVSAKQMNSVLDLGLTIGRNSLYREMRQVMKDPDKYFSFRSDLGKEVSKLRGVVNYVQSLVSNREEAEKVGIEKLEALKTHENYLDQNKKMSGMKLVQIEANAYSILYSQLMGSVDQVIGMLRPIDLSVSDETTIPTHPSDDVDQLRREIEAGSIYTRGSPEDPNIRTTYVDESSIIDGASQHISTVALHDLRMPENDSLKALYLTLNRINKDGMALAVQVEDLTATIDSFGLNTRVERLSTEDKTFLSGVVDYLKNDSAGHFGHFTRDNPTSAHVPTFLSTYSLVQ